MGINTGILQNATPLSAARIKELEREVLENGKTFAYLDEGSQLCFLSNRTPEAIKELAWNNAYKIAAGQDGLVRAEYKKTSLNSFYLNRTSTKNDITDEWLFGSVLDGTGSEYHTATPAPLSFRSDAPLSEFQEVQINGQTLDPVNYTLQEGSTIVKLSIDYLDTLTEGQYSIAVVSNNKTVNGSFKVKNPILNEYGFYYNMPYQLELDDEILYLVFTQEGFMYLLGAADIQAFSVLPPCQWTIQNSILTATYEDELVLEVAVTSDSGSLVLEDSLLTVCMDTICVKGDFIYKYNKFIEGYVVTALDITKTHYQPILDYINNVPTIAFGMLAFCGLESAGSIEVAPLFPSTLKIIASGTFMGCPNLRSVIIPDQPLTIEAGAFNDCQLTEVYISDIATWCQETRLSNNTDIFSENTVLYINGKPTYDLVIPEGITKIGSNSFYNCNTITSLHLPSSLKEIDSYAFSYCSSLGIITYAGTVEQWNAVNSHSSGLDRLSVNYIQCTNGKVTI